MALNMYSVKSNICTHEDLDSSNSNNGSDCEITHPVLLNEVVLHCMFQFLNLTDLKHCRSVCEKWNRVSEVMFKTKGRVCFYFLKNDAEEVRSSATKLSKYPAPIDLNEYFRNSQQEVKISSLGLSNRLPWPPSKLAEFFATEGKFITNLKLQDVILPVAENDRFSFHENYDLISLIGNNLRLKNLYLLSNSNSTGFKLSLNDLSNIPHIWLTMCKIELKDDTKIAPVGLTLHRVILCRGTEKIDKIPINDFIDFRAMKKLMLLNGGFTKLSLDLTGSVKLDYMYLKEIDILNFKRSSWNIDILDLTASFIQTKSNLKFSNLSIDNTKLALNSLPHALKRLTLSINVDIVEGNLWNISLPHVTELNLSRNAMISLCLPNLKNCFTMLTDLNMIFDETNIIIDTNMIPRTVRSLTFSEGNIDFIGEEVLQLEKVFVWINDFQFANKVAKHFAPVNLIVSYIEALPDEYQVEISALLSLFRTNIPQITIYVSRKILEDLLKNFHIFQGTRRCFCKIAGAHIELVHNLDSLLNSKRPCSDTKVYYECLIPQQFGTRFVRTTDGKKIYY